MLISVEWHKNISLQLWHASSNMQIQKSTVYEGCSVSPRPKVLRSRNPHTIVIWHVCRSTQLMNIYCKFEAITISCFFFLLQIIKHSQLAVSNLLDLENGKMDKIGHCAVFLDGGRLPGFPYHVWIRQPTSLPCWTKGYPLQVWPPCLGGLAWVLSPWDQGSGWPHDVWFCHFFFHFQGLDG